MLPFNIAAVPIDLTPYHAVLLDLDGTLYHDDQPLPGSQVLIARLKRLAKPYACLTNSPQDSGRVAQRLAELDMAIDGAHIYTAAEAVADYIVDRFPAGEARVLNLATEGMQSALDGKVHWVKVASEACDVVIVGNPLSVFATEDRLRLGVTHLRQGAVCVGVCADRIYPSPRGVEIGCGSMTMMLAYAAGVEPVFCGKPQPIFFRKLCQRLGVVPEQCILIGDNLESDIAGAKSVGMQTILTLTGVVEPKDVPAIPLRLKPDYVIDNLQSLF